MISSANLTGVGESVFQDEPQTTHTSSTETANNNPEPVAGHDRDGDRGGILDAPGSGSELEGFPGSADSADGDALNETKDNDSGNSIPDPADSRNLDPIQSESRSEGRRQRNLDAARRHGPTDRTGQIEAGITVETVTPAIQQGSEINSDSLLSAERKLWRLEKYADRHGSTRVRRVLRFVGGKPPKIELGKVTDGLSEALSQRPGRGRWSQSRADADAYRLLAYAVAERFERAKAGRSGDEVLSGGRSITDRSDERICLPDPSDSALWPEVSSVQVM